MDKSSVANSEDASSLLAVNVLYTLVNFGSYDELIDKPVEQPKVTIEEHLYLHFLPFL